MEKSMVHQLNPLVASSVHYSRASFIHTVYQTDFSELRKSRIQNLPNYKKQDLSGKLNFVVVFQGIEIQRLSIQIQTLRIKTKDYERQICNYENYQVQIRELTQKCHSYEMQRQDHQQAMQKMHKICQQLYNQLQQMRARYADIDLSLKEKYRLEKQRCQSLSHQLQKWKARYNASETSKVKQLQDMRMMLENQRKSMLQRQIREISVKYQSERSMLESELRKLRQNLQNRNSQIQRMRFQLQQGKVRQGELRQYESRLDEYEDKLMMMAQQNMRLNELLRMKKQEIQTLKNNQRNLQNRLTNFKKIQDEFNQVNRRIQSYQVQIREWNKKYSILQAENNRNQILSNKAQQYERLLDNSAEEMQKLNTIIRQKISEIEKWRSQTQRLTMQLEQSRSTQTKICEYEETISQIATQNQRLNEVLRGRLQQIQNWKSKYAQIESRMPLLIQSQNECKNLRQKLTVQVNKRAKMSSTISVLQKDLSKAAQLQQALIKQKSGNKDLQRQIQRLNGSIRSLSSQNGDFTKKIQSLELQMKQSSGIVEELNQCKRKIIIMTQQIDRINGVIHQKIQQIKHLKDNYNSVSINIGRYRQIQEQFVTNLQQTQQLVLRLDESRRENQCIQENLLNRQGRCKKLQSQMFTSNEQKQKLITIINQKKVQLQDLVGIIEKSDQKITVLQQIEQQYKSLKTSYSQLQQKCKDLQIRYSKQIKRSQELSNQIQILATEVLKLKTQTNFSKQFVSEFTTIKTQSEEKDRLIMSLLQKVASVQKCIVLLKQQNKKNFNNMSQHHARWTSLNSSFQIVASFMDKFVEFQGKIERLSEQNLKLQTGVNMMNIQMAESTYASQDSYNKIQEQRIIVSSPTYSKQTISTLHQRQDISPSAKLSAIEEEVYRESSRQNIQVKTFSPNVYYQSQVRELYGNGYQQPNSYSNFQTTTSNIQESNSFNQGSSSNLQGGNYFKSQRPSQGYVSHTVKTLRPGSQQSTATYTYSANYRGNNYRGANFSGSQITPNSNVTNMNHMNHHFSNLSNAERPGSFIKPAKHSVSEVRTSPDMKDQLGYQQTQGRRYVLSPVRFLN